MKNKLLKHNIKEICYIALAWVILTTFFLYIKFNDISGYYFQIIYGQHYKISKQELFIVSLGTSIPLGLMLGILHTYVYPRLRRLKLIIVIILRIFLFCLLLVTIELVFYILFENNSGNFGNELFRKQGGQTILVYTLSTEFLTTVLIILRRSLGGGYFSSLLKNTYGNPREEERVFMFLDLEDSTPIAEKIGHLDYSKFIQDCFWDLSDVVLKYEGEIYQFVGDEAVITWKVNSEIDYLKCIDLYYNFSEILNNRGKYYTLNYGHLPKFRCAIHNGKVSTALVGNYKREIAYHGDVLNLCARIQAECKDNKANVLVSEYFAKHLKSSDRYTFSQLVFSNLKGIKCSQIAFIVNPVN
ncbi:adenylate/guanylate cyclase domain-containing protein [Chondrinema litorale]|uniref:adenylate/guanylate cyclase domain-containing protein n=1 Tax=Chondrinema litorale TaxID=2994555 RepID=UPI002542C26A|nr:adenylate/guanylate cyclase domain-containing protein [Chondrinema litorale]UZR98522.1 adenylate/guanylate cyclase domain-containing protein [Chondrinema litorale]